MSDKEIFILYLMSLGHLEWGKEYTPYIKILVSGGFIYKEYDEALLYHIPPVNKYKVSNLGIEYIQMNKWRLFWLRLKHRFKRVI